MKYKFWLAAAAMTVAAQASATPAMSVLTINAKDPMGYMKWAQKSGPAIGKSVTASVGGICAATTGYYAPGELYYWHIFPDHATAMGANTYNDTVMQELSKLEVERTVSRADAYSVAMAEPLNWDEGDTFSNWNLFVSTDDPGLYMQQLARITGAAKENGFDDIALAAYGSLTGEEAGNLLVVIQAPNGNRLGQFLDQMNSDWMAPIMADLSGIRSYRRGFTMNCTVVYSED
jgi:hypothetical protein